MHSGVRLRDAGREPAPQHTLPARSGVPRSAAAPGFALSGGQGQRGAEVLVTGAGEPTSRIHGPDGSQDLSELQRSILGEALALQGLARR